MTPIYDALLSERYPREPDFWIEVDNNTRPLPRWPERQRGPHQFAPPYTQWEAERD